MHGTNTKTPSSSQFFAWSTSVHNPAETPAIVAALEQVAPPPVGRPALLSVLAGAIAALDAYQAVLPAPHADIERWRDSLDEALLHFGAVDPDGLTRPLYRRLTRQPAWVMFAHMGKSTLDSKIVEAAGAELATCLDLHRQFSPGLARAIVAEYEGSRQRLAADGQPIWLKKAPRVRRAADVHFLLDGGLTADAPKKPLAHALRQHYRNRIEFARDRAHQCVVDHRSLSAAQMLASAQEIRQQAEAGNEDALLAVVCVLTGIGPDLALAIPLANGNGIGAIALDVERGCVLVDLDLIAPGRARPAVESAGATREVDRLIVKPLPEFVARALRKCAALRPEAGSVRSLLPTATIAMRTALVPTDHDASPGIMPSLARFSNGFAPYAVRAGVDPYIAALLANDPAIVPTGKFYYARAEYVEIELAAETAYAALGWDAPVRLSNIPAVGSAMVPTESSLVAWGEWMRTQVLSARPARRYSLWTLIAYHNTYALAVGSNLVFALALRERKVLPMTAAACIHPARSIAILDKAVGAIRAPRPVPLAPSVSAQIGHWFDHCGELDRRLDHLGVPPSTKSRKYLAGVQAGRSVPLLFFIHEKGNAQPVSSADLAAWWPARFGFPANVGRHYWQNALREHGVPSRWIDAYVRHSLRGDDPAGSTACLAPTRWTEGLRSTVEQILCLLQLTPLRGLHRRD